MHKLMRAGQAAHGKLAAPAPGGVPRQDVSWRRTVSILSVAVLGIALLTGFVAGGTTSAASNAAAPPVPRVRFVPGSSGVTLKDLVAGAAGSGTLLYYLPSLGPARPSLVVQLERIGHSPTASAQVYQAGANRPYVPINITERGVRLPATVHPTITMLAQGGWWFRRGLPNYNLQITVKGQIYAMWGYPSYASLDLPFEFSIVTHADAHGVPQWDLRRLLTNLGAAGAIRTNYVERRCNGPLQRDRSPSPLWPYVAARQAYSFGQPNGRLQPPISVDWQSGRILIFNEVVSLRFQSCSYGLYSLDPPTSKSVSEPSFESPWGFYDLSGHHNGYPNLIIRTEHFPAKSFWYPAVDSALYSLPAPSRPSEVVRYSWADHAGNDKYDYKVDVLGFHAYRSTQSLAGGSLRLRQPGYRQYPGWVVGQQWPLATFVDTNGASYNTSEGIYDWSSDSVGAPYWLGWTGTPDMKRFRTIFKGLRGEYRFGVNDRPVLYASPIDHRMHLLHAEGGLWNIRKGLTVHESNLTGGLYIDDWQLQRTHRSAAGSHTAATGKVVQETAALDGYILSSGPGGVTIRQSPYREEAFRILPPTDARTWTSFKARTAAFHSNNTPPPISTWADHFAGPAWRADRASLSAIHATSSGFRAVLHLAPNAHARGHVATLNVPGRFGSYVLTYNRTHHHWSIERATPPQLTVRLIPARHTTELYPTNLGVNIHNHGTEDWQGRLTLTVPAAKVKGKILYRRIDSRTVTVGGQQLRRLIVHWSPKPAGRDPIHIHLSGQPPTVQIVEVRPTPRPSAHTMIAVSVPTRLSLLESIVLVLFIVGGTVLLWRRAYGRV